MDNEIIEAFNKFKNSGKIEDYLEYRRIIKEKEQKKRWSNMIKEFEGIIVSETPYSESSKIINILTKEGIIGVMAKGAKRLKSPFRTTTEKFSLGTFNVYFHEGKLSTLISADIINPLNNIKTDIVKIGYLTYICELSYQTAKQKTDSNIYTILKSAILKMENGLDPMVITNILELKMLDYLGVKIDLDKCIKCGDTENIITISGDAGGYLCKDCRTNEIIYDIKTIKMFRLYYYVEIDSITDLKISESVANNINKILTDYYDRYTGLYLKSKEFLKSVTY